MQWKENKRSNLHTKTTKLVHAGPVYSSPICFIESALQKQNSCWNFSRDLAIKDLYLEGLGLGTSGFYADTNPIRPLRAFFVTTSTSSHNDLLGSSSQIRCLVYCVVEYAMKAQLARVTWGSDIMVIIHWGIKFHLFWTSESLLLIPRSQCIHVIFPLASASSYCISLTLLSDCWPQREWKVKTSENKSQKFVTLCLLIAALIFGIICDRLRCSYKSWSSAPRAKSKHHGLWSALGQSFHRGCLSAGNNP